MSSSDEKLDKIISLLEEQSAELKKINSNSGGGSLDKELQLAKEYMMKHFNIKWLNDNIEEDIYDAIIAVIEKFLV